MRGFTDLKHRMIIDYMQGVNTSTLQFREK